MPLFPPSEATQPQMYVGLSPPQQSIPPNMVTNIAFNTVLYDPDSLWDSLNSQFVAPDDGVYFASLGVLVGFSAATTQLQLFIVGTINTATCAQRGNAAVSQTMNTSGIFRLSKGDVLIPQIVHDNGANVDIGFSDTSSNFYVIRLSPL